MQGLFFKETSEWDDNLPGYTGKNYFCIEGKAGKIHITEDFYGNNDPVVELIGPCDGSCNVLVDVDAVVEAFVNTLP